MLLIFHNTSCNHGQKLTTWVDDRSFLDTLSSVVQSGTPVLLWAGDADWICNYLGGQRVAEAVSYSGHAAFEQKVMEPYMVQGAQKGTYKAVDNLTFLRVFEAGHEVPYYRKHLPSHPFTRRLERMLMHVIPPSEPATALQVFTQIMQQKRISST